MNLTPTTVRLDLKCGKGSISEGEKCSKGMSTAKKAAIVAGIGAVGAALLHKGSRKAILNAPSAAKRAAQQAVTEVVHRATAKPPSMKLSRKSFEQLRPPSKTQRLKTVAQAANREAEQAIGKAAQAEVERAATVGKAMFKAGKATRASLRSGMRTHKLTVEALRRKYEPGYRKARAPQRSDNFIQHYAPVQIQPPTRRDATDGKKYSKTVTNPETGRNTPLCLSRAKWACSGKTSRRDGVLTPGKSSA